MGIGKRLYPPDEISAKGDRPMTKPTHGEAARAGHVTKFLGECRWEPDMPAQRRTAHNQALIATCLAAQADTATVMRNRPVPRTAGCQYDGVKSLSLTNGPSTFYFY